MYVLVSGQRLELTICVCTCTCVFCLFFLTVLLLVAAQCSAPLFSEATPPIEQELCVMIDIYAFLFLPKK